MQVGKFTPSKKIHTHSIPFLAQVPVSGVHNLSLSLILISFTLTVKRLHHFLCFLLLTWYVPAPPTMTTLLTLSKARKTAG